MIIWSIANRPDSSGKIGGYVDLSRGSRSTSSSRVVGDVRKILLHPNRGRIAAAGRHG